MFHGAHLGSQNHVSSNPSEVGVCSVLRKGFFAEKLKVSASTVWSCLFRNSPWHFSCITFFVAVNAPLSKSGVRGLYCVLMSSCFCFGRVFFLRPILWLVAGLIYCDTESISSTDFFADLLVAFSVSNLTLGRPVLTLSNNLSIGF